MKNYGGSLKNPIFRGGGGEGGVMRSQYIGGIAWKGWVGGLDSLQIWEGAWWKRGGDVFEGAWYPNAHYENVIPLSANPFKWSNTIKGFVGNSWRIVWVCLTILWVWRLKGFEM